MNYWVAFIWGEKFGWLRTPFNILLKGVGMVVSIDEVKELQNDLKNDYIINSELSAFAGCLALRCGTWLAAADAALITTKHIDFNASKEPDKEPDKEPGEERGKEPV